MKRGPVVGEVLLPDEARRAKKIWRGDGIGVSKDHHLDKEVDAFRISSSIKNKRAAQECTSVIDLQERKSAEELVQTPQEEEETEARDVSSSSVADSSSGNEESSCEDEDLENGRRQKRTDDSTAFGRAFQKIMRKKLPVSVLNDAMGPMLSAHKQLVAKKLEEAEEGRTKRSEKKKEKHALRGKGHLVPVSYVNAKEKELIKLATRGVVKLFNAVSKVQSCDVGAKMTKSSDAKELVKQNKSTFLSMLQGTSGSSFEEQRQPLDNNKETTPHKPGWSALQDSFMLGKARLKDWDKKQDDDAGLDTTGDSSDDSDWK